MSNVYTYTTEIKNRAYNVDLMKYITEYKGLFNFVQRKAFHIIKNSYINTGKFTLKDNGVLTKNIATTYNLTARAAASIVYNMTGRFNSIKELKEYEKQQLETKIKSLEKKITKTERARQGLNLRMALNTATKKEQERYEKLKISLYWRRNKLNKLKRKIKKVEKEIKTQRYKVCFGTKKLLQTDFSKFIEQRDSEVFYVGRVSDTACNNNFQMSYNKKDNQFYLKIRKEISNIAPQKIIDNQRYHDSLIIELLKINSGLICFGRIKRKTSTMPILYSSKLP